MALFYSILSLRLVGLVLFSGYFIWSGLDHFINAKSMIGYATFKKIPAPAIAVYVTGVLMILGGLGVLLQIFPEIAAFRDLAITLLAIFLVPTTFLMHAFWKDTDPATRMSNRINFLKNLALLGAVLLML